ncbi:MAG: c-type cytochrome [Ferruginibacter sp.]
MKKTIILSAIIGLGILGSCGGNKSENKSSDGSKEEGPKSMVSDPAKYDPKRGEGKYTAENLKLGVLDNTLATEGEKIAGVKCTSCHKTTDEKLVGPGWKGVTARRAPEWIMNFITNPEGMIEKDPELQAQLEICLVRMPNQSLTDTDARNLLEFMRKNDGVK